MAARRPAPPPPRRFWRLLLDASGLAAAAAAAAAVAASLKKGGGELRGGICSELSETANRFLLFFFSLASELDFLGVLSFFRFVFQKL